MFDKTQVKATELSVAITEDTNQAISTVKAMVVPAIANVFGSLAGYANKVKAGVESGELFAKAKTKVDETTAAAVAAAAAATKPAPEAAAPFPTAAQNDAIKVLRLVGKNDEEIAVALNISVLTVKQATA